LNNFLSTGYENAATYILICNLLLRYKHVLSLPCCKGRDFVVVFKNFHSSRLLKSTGTFFYKRENTKHTILIFQM
jgi:hypothetical protein